jgi:hypothetical protein
MVVSSSSAPSGQNLTQAPHRLQRSFTTGLRFCIRIASSGQSRAQIPQLVHFSLSTSMEFLYGPAIIPVCFLVVHLKRRMKTDLTFL